MKKAIILAAILAASPAPAAPADPAPAPEASIPFVSRDGILDWRADGRRGLYIRGINGRWYYARTQGLCGRLVTALALGFETSALDQLDRYGAIRAQGARCPIASLVGIVAAPKEDSPLIAGQRSRERLRPQRSS